MTYRYSRRYVGPLKAAVLDWAGTMVDFGSLAPVGAFSAIFAEAGIAVELGEVRAPMGQAKWQHIRSMADMPRIAAAWQQRYGHPAGKEDIDSLYARFLPRQTEAAAERAVLIPGVLEMAAMMRARGMKLASVSGYPRQVMEAVAARAAEQGLVPDCVISADDTPTGRPSPFPAWRALEAVGIWPVEAAVKIGDTVADIEEGLHGGMWSVGVAVSGNEVGLDLASWQALPEAEQRALYTQAKARLAAAGAHYVVDTIAAIGPVLDDIDARLARGEKP